MQPWLSLQGLYTFFASVITIIISAIYRSDSGIVCCQVSNQIKFITSEPI